MSKEEDKEMIDHPDHYNQGKIEVIAAIEDWDLNFCEGNVIKYTLRHDMKGGVEDIDKAIRYLQMIKEEKYNAKG